jgi:hypothetical protein
MSAIWKYQAQRLNQLIDENNEIQAHIYMEQLLLFPVDVQDRIIEEISLLPQCSRDAVANILGSYSVTDLS